MKGGFLSIIVYSLKLYKTQDMFDNSLCLSHNQYISEGIIFRVGKKKNRVTGKLGQTTNHAFLPACERFFWLMQV